jgi:hypothetical protein
MFSSKAKRSRKKESFEKDSPNVLDWKAYLTEFRIADMEICVDHRRSPPRSKRSSLPGASPPSCDISPALNGLLCVENKNKINCMPSYAQSFSCAVEASFLRSETSCNCTWEVRNSYVCENLYADGFIIRREFQMTMVFFREGRGALVFALTLGTQGSRSLSSGSHRYQFVSTRPNKVGLGPC